MLLLSCFQLVHSGQVPSRQSVHRVVSLINSHRSTFSAFAILPITETPVPKLARLIDSMVQSQHAARKYTATIWRDNPKWAAWQATVG